MADNPMSKRGVARRFKTTTVLLVSSAIILAALFLPDWYGVLSQTISKKYVRMFENPATQLAAWACSSADAQMESRYSDLMIRQAKGETFYITSSVMFHKTRLVLLPILITLMATGAYLGWKWEMGLVRQVLAVLAGLAILLAPFITVLLEAIYIRVRMPSGNELDDLLKWNVAENVAIIVSILIAALSWWLLKIIIIQEDDTAAPVN